VADAVAALRRDGAERVAVASWLLAPGLFQRRLDESGADVVAGPLSDHPAVVELVVRRYRAALSGARRTA
jgi:sirohydrochlorin ferrochelatase